MDVTDPMPDLDLQWQALTIDDMTVNNTDVELDGAEQGNNQSKIKEMQLDFVTDEPR